MFSKMRAIILFTVAVLAFLASTSANHIFVGSNINTKLVHTIKAEYHPILFKKRVIEESYSDPKQQIIKGIICNDSDHKKATATITSGGVGVDYVNIRLKSGRGHGLNYICEIYV